MFGFSTQASYNQGPWSGLPTASAPWGGSPQVWQPAQQAPWRLSPWSTQGMPPAAPVAPAAQNIPAAPPPNPYLSQGTSAGIPGFNPMVPGGGMYPAPASAPAPAPAPAQDLYWIPGMGAASGGGTGAERFTVDPYAPGAMAVDERQLRWNPELANVLPPTHPLSIGYQERQSVDLNNPSTWFQ